MTIPQLHFGPFSLEPESECLKRGSDPVKLRPMSLHVLRYLSERPGQFVSKEELLERVWTGRVISDSGLRLCVKEIRAALGDQAQSPQYVETIVGRGYRFLEGPNGRAALTDTAGQMVGRETELQQLQDYYRLAAEGNTQFVLLAGEPGIGKTTLVESFLERMVDQSAANIIQGQCVVHFGNEETYGPLLESIAALCRTPKGSEFIRVFKRYAPTWLLHIPGLLDATDFERLRHQVESMAPDQMTREFTRVVEVLAEKEPLVIVIEDLHWADVATIDLLASLAEHVALPLLILGTYRPADAVLYRRSLRDTIKELKGRDHCHEIMPELLTRHDVTDYLAGRLSGEVSSKLIKKVHRRSGGNPLFMVKLVEEMMQTQALGLQDGQWNVVNGAEDEVVPESLQSLISRHLDALPEATKEVLEAASVVGLEFSAAALAGALQLDTDEIDRQCELLAVDYQFIESRDVRAWPDGTLTGYYRFQHALYLEVIYAQLGKARRVHLHRGIAERFEQAYGERAQEIAAELAVHFERGLDTVRAIQYWKLAAKQSSNLHAYATTIDQFGYALDQLKQLPETVECNKQELELLMLLGPVQVADGGYSGPEVEQTFRQAEVLCEQFGDSGLHFTVLWNLAGFRMARGELPQCRRLLDQAVAVMRKFTDDDVILMTHDAYAQQLFLEGEFTAAHEQAKYVVSHYSVEQHQHLAESYCQEDPGVVCTGFDALALWLLGHTDQSRDRLKIVAKWSSEIDNPHSVGFGLLLSCMACQLRTDPEATLETVDRLVALSTRYDLHYIPFGMTLKAWAMARLDPDFEPLEMAQDGLEMLLSSGAKIFAPYLLGLIADIQRTLGQIHAAQASVEQALAQVEKSNERWFEAELHRLQGELLLQQDSSQQKEAEQCFSRSLEVARAQQARSLELRTALSFSQIYEKQGNSSAARLLLQPIIAGFSEASDSPELRDARTLIA
jgi:DNA-binding winged helix-turn-helix (wHTH) protein/predicted ATPase